MKYVKCKFLKASTVECRWRRLAVHEQQAERQKKNLLQKVLFFKTRAAELMVEDRSHSPDNKI